MVFTRKELAGLPDNKSLKDFSGDIHSYIEYLFNVYNMNFFKKKLSIPEILLVPTITTGTVSHKNAKGAFFKPNTLKFVNSLFSNLKLVKLPVVKGITEKVLVGTLSSNNEKFFKALLLHEMCHQAVYQIDKDHDNTDGDHGFKWKSWMKKCGQPISKLYQLRVLKNPKIGDSCCIVLNANTPQEHVYYGKICNVKRKSVLCVVIDKDVYYAGEFESKYVFSCDQPVRIKNSVLPNILNEYNQRTDKNPDVSVLQLNSKFQVIEEIAMPEEITYGI